MRTVEEVAARIDHAVLKPEMTEADVRAHAAMCRKRKVASLCVRPCDVKLAASELAGSNVSVSCVLSFPHGADVTKVKISQAKQALEDGVEEIDMVMNIGQFLSGNFDQVRKDIKAVVDVAHAEGAIVKVIQESALLTLDQVEQASILAWEAGADFVKTSTGFGPSSATPEIIAAMKRAVGGHMKIKASGGIRDWASAVAYLDQGVDRLGIGATEVVLDGGTVEGAY